MQYRSLLFGVALVNGKILQTDLTLEQLHHRPYTTPAHVKVHISHPNILRRDPLCCGTSSGNSERCNL